MMSLTVEIADERPFDCPETATVDRSSDVFGLDQSVALTLEVAGEPNAVLLRVASLPRRTDGSDHPRPRPSPGQQHWVAPPRVR